MPIIYDAINICYICIYLQHHDSASDRAAYGRWSMARPASAPRMYSFSLFSIILYDIILCYTTIIVCCYISFSLFLYLSLSLSVHIYIYIYVSLLSSLLSLWLSLLIIFLLCLTTGVRCLARKRARSPRSPSQTRKVRARPSNNIHNNTNNNVQQ